MDRSRVYLALALLGALVPYGFFFRFFIDQGFGIQFLPAVFVNGAAAGFTADLLISSVVFWIWMAQDVARRRAEGAMAPPIWPFVLLNLSIGLSCALPAWLWWLERRSDAVAPA